MSGLRLLVDRPIDDLRENLESTYFGFFESFELPPMVDADDLQDLVEVVPPGSTLPFDLSEITRDRVRLLAWLQTATEDTFTSIDREAGTHPIDFAILLFAPGVPCIALSQIRGDNRELIEFRSSHPAFSGVFSFSASNEGELRMSWDLGIEFARLQVDPGGMRGVIAHSSPDGKETFPVPGADPA